MYDAYLPIPYKCTEGLIPQYPHLNDRDTLLKTTVDRKDRWLCDAYLGFGSRLIFEKTL